MPDPAMETALEHVEDPDLRAAIERAHQAAQRTPEEIAAEAEAARKQQLREERRELREAAHRAIYRALEGEWGDDVRRAVDAAVHEARPGVAALADWHRALAKGDRLTPLDLQGVRHALDREDVRDAVREADKIITEAEKERRESAKKGASKS